MEEVKTTEVEKTIDETKIQITGGEVVLKKPLAKAFYTAMEESEISNGQLKVTKMFNILMPYCIKTHPWGVKPIRQAIDSLDVEDYLKIFNKLKEVIVIDGNVQGK